MISDPAESELFKNALVGVADARARTGFPTTPPGALNAQHAQAAGTAGGAGTSGARGGGGEVRAAQ